MCVYICVCGYMCMRVFVVQSLSCVWLFAIPWTAARQASLSFTSSQSLFKFMFIESVMPSKHLILCRPLLLLFSVFPSIRSFLWTQFFARGGQSIGASASASVLPMNIQDWFFFRIDWLDLLAVQGILKSLLQHHIKSINSSALSFLYGPPFTYACDHWKNDSFD